MKKSKSLNESGISLLEVLVGIIIGGLIIYFISMIMINMKYQEKKETIKVELLFQSNNILELFTADPVTFIDNLNNYYETDGDKIIIKINHSINSYLMFTFSKEINEAKSSYHLIISFPKEYEKEKYFKPIERKMVLYA